MIFPVILKNLDNFFSYKFFMLANRLLGSAMNKHKNGRWPYIILLVGLHLRSYDIFLWHITQVKEENSSDFGSVNEIVLQIPETLVTEAVCLGGKESLQESHFGLSHPSFYQTSSHHDYGTSYNLELPPLKHAIPDEHLAETGSMEESMLDLSPASLYRSTGRKLSDGSILFQQDHTLWELSDEDRDTKGWESAPTSKKRVKTTERKRHVSAPSRTAEVIRKQLVFKKCEGRDNVMLCQESKA